MAVKVLISEAYCDENRKAGYEKGGGVPGDQLQRTKSGDDTVGEVRISNYRAFATIIIRYKDRDLARAHAAASRFFSNSALVGYSQPDRLSLNTEVVRVGYNNYKSISNKCNCDCSSLQSLCARMVGVAEFKSWATSNMVTGFNKLYLYQHGKINAKEVPAEFLVLDKYFTILKEERYLVNSDYLMEGDLMLKDGHIAVVLNDGAMSVKYSTLEKAAGTNPDLIGVYTVNCPLNLRYGSSTDYQIIKVLKQGEKLKSTKGKYGANPNWIRIKEVSTNIIGYVNSSYITKVGKK